MICAELLEARLSGQMRRTGPHVKSAATLLQHVWEARTGEEAIENAVRDEKGTEMETEQGNA